MSYNAIQREAREILLGSADEPPATEQEARLIETIELQEDERLLAERFDPAEAAQVHKIRENRARRMAQRQGLQLIKSRRRDPRAIDFGGFMLVNAYTNSVAEGGSPWPFSMSIDQIEERLLR